MGKISMAVKPSVHKLSLHFGARVLENLPKLDRDRIQEYVSDPRLLKKVLHDTFRPHRLFLCTTQKTRVMDGFEIFKILTEAQLIRRGEGNKLLAHWLDNPETYPEDYRDQKVHFWGLWKEEQADHAQRRVPYIFWDDTHKRTRYAESNFEDTFNASCPALLL